jgi:hypothetical protein
MTEAPWNVGVAARVGVEPEWVEHEPGVVRCEGSHASPLEAARQGQVEPGVPGGDLEVAVEYACLLSQETVGQGLPALDGVRRPKSANDFLWIGGELLGRDQRACMEVLRHALRVQPAGIRRSDRGQALSDGARGLLASDVCAP